MTEVDFSKYVSLAKARNKHPAKASVLNDLLKEVFGVELKNLLSGVETNIKINGIRGSIDLLFKNVIFEIKTDIKLELPDAEYQLKKKYFPALYDRYGDENIVGIVTDVVEFIAYTPIIKNNEVVAIEQISSINIEESPDNESLLWLDSFIFSEYHINANAEDLKFRFGSLSPTYAIINKNFENLWNEVKDHPDVEIKFDLWKKNMELVYGKEPDLKSFFDHTYLVTLVKLIIYLRLAETRIISQSNISLVLSGEYFANFGIVNLVEEDFFSWIIHKDISSKASEICFKFSQELSKYDFKSIDEDFFREIYQEIVERGQRHKIGEYYTPEWLSKLTLEETLKFWNDDSIPKIIDPACGSGTFLSASIRKIKIKYPNKEELLDFIINNIVGVDINPVAVIISKANYLLSLGDLLQFRKNEISIPVYVADTIRLPKTTKTLAKTSSGSFEVIEYNFKDYSLLMPRNVAKNRIKLNKVIDVLKKVITFYKSNNQRNKAHNLFTTELPFLTDIELDLLKSTLNTLFDLIDEELDGIWIFILSNIYATISLSQSKFDILIGNPPWISLRYIENSGYKDFIKNQVFRYKLLNTNESHLFTHMEVATLFFRRCEDLYLKEKGIISFVMPRSVLTGAFQHEKFKNFENPKTKLLKILDFEKVEPIFNVPSCVLIGLKGEKNTYPVLTDRFSGYLEKKNISINELSEFVSKNSYEYMAPIYPEKNSFYHDKFKEGATIIPRKAFFIELMEPNPIMGMDSSKPFVKSFYKGARRPWREIEIENKIESEYLYLTIVGEGLYAFRYDTLPVVLPIKPRERKFAILDSDQLVKSGSIYMAEYLNKAQKWWENLASSDQLVNYPKIINYLDYQSKLSLQNPSKRYLIIYNSSGANLVACVVDRHSLTENIEIKIKGFVVDHVTYYYQTDDLNEAHYLCSVLNSNVLNDLIKPLQPVGQKSYRHIHRRPLMFPIPRFNSENPYHRKLAEISKNCHNIVSRIEFKNVKSRRKDSKNAVKEELLVIDRIVHKMFESRR